jgi:hypothetical protein
MLKIIRSKRLIEMLQNPSQTNRDALNKVTSRYFRNKHVRKFMQNVIFLVRSLLLPPDLQLVKSDSRLNSMMIWFNGGSTWRNCKHRANSFNNSLRTMLWIRHIPWSWFVLEDLGLTAALANASSLQKSVWAVIWRVPQQFSSNMHAIWLRHKNQSSGTHL